MRYSIKFNSEFNNVAFESNSRNVKKFCRDYGVQSVVVYQNSTGAAICGAARDANDNIFNTYVSGNLHDYDD